MGRALTHLTSIGLFEIIESAVAIEGCVEMTLRRVLLVLLVFQAVSGGWLGVIVQDLTPRLAFRYGLLVKEGSVVTRVQFDSPAMKGGLQEGDVIISLNGQKVSNSETLKKLLTNTPSGSHVDLVIIRHRQKKSLEILLGSPPRNAA
ncbi:MAG: PDZ domain-containing protein [Nitrospiria bacterium]